MSRLRIRRSGPLSGRASLPSDLHIGQQALVWAALSEGPCELTGLSPRLDHGLLMTALRELGVPIVAREGGCLVQGVGLRGLRLPRGALDAGESESTLELLVALLAGQRFGTRVEARGRAGEHPLRTLLEPLRERGAHVRGRTNEQGAVHAPVAVAPLLEGEPLEGVEIAIPSGDPTTKLGLLISGLYARGPTAVHEGMLSRDHAERALMALGAEIQTAAGMTLLERGEGDPNASWPGFSWQIPGDFTLASFVLAAALLVPESHVLLENVGLNPTRTALLEALRATGAQVSLTPKGDVAGDEPLGQVRVRGGRVTRLRVGGERALGLLDEVPALAALAACSRDRVSIRDVGPLRSRASDGIKETTELLRRFGIGSTVYDDGFEIDPPERIQAARVEAGEPPSQKLLACVLGLAAEGETVVDGAETLDALYPGLVTTLIQLGAAIAREESP